MKSLSKKEWIGVVGSVVFIGYTMFGQTISDSFKQSTGKSVENGAAVALSGDAPAPNIKTQDLTVGSGALISRGMTVEVNYILKLENGTLIQDSKQVNGGKPFSFVFGAGELIPGWEMGIAGMRVGGKRIITIPPELGYGSQSVGPIPANSTLVFEIEVVSAQ